MNIFHQSADEAIGHSPVVSVSILPYKRPMSVGIYRPEAAATDAILLGDNRQFRDGSIIWRRRGRKVARGNWLKPLHARNGAGDLNYESGIMDRIGMTGLTLIDVDSRQP